MTILLFSQIFIVCLLGAMSPGPSMVVVVNNAIFKSKFSGILTAIGMVLELVFTPFVQLLELG